MILAPLLFAALSIAFPRENERLPFITKCYVIGAVEEGVTNVAVASTNVVPYQTGAWATRIAVNEGTNTICATSISPDGKTTNTLMRTFYIAPQPTNQIKSAAVATTNKPAPKVWKKLEYAADEAQQPPTNRAPQDITIYLDPGHGGTTDRGAISPHGWHEKDANLKLALAVREALTNRGFKVVMTRETDKALNLFERAREAHEHKADAFVSVHHNAPAADADVAHARYAAVYSWNSIGEKLAAAISTRMNEVQQTHLPSKGALHANFVVTRSPQIPSCLIEADFITHPEAEADIWNMQKRRALAEAIARGIADWCKQ